MGKVCYLGVMGKLILKTVRTDGDSTAGTLRVKVLAEKK